MRAREVWVLTVIVGCVCTLSAAPWPRFRGPNGNGTAGDKDIPTQWTPKEGMLWRTPIPGLGNSSPVVWGERLFVQSASPDGKSRSLLCLDVASGKVLWTRSVAGHGVKKHPKNTFASSTPATDGTRVYAVFWDGEQVFLRAYDLQGTELWNYEIGGFTSQHGVGASPVVYKEMVFLMNDQDGAAEMIAVLAQTGKLSWRVARRPYRACYSSPLLVERKGEEAELIVASTGGITSYRPATGARNWEYEWTFDGMPLRTVASPVVSEDMIIVNSGDGGGARHTVAVKMMGKGQETKPSLVWEAKRGYPYVPTMLTYGEHLYVVNDKGVASCHVAATGEKVWTHRLGGDVTASPILIDGKIYAIDENGAVFVFAAAPEFKLVGKSEIGEPVMATPAVADNRLFIRTSKQVLCIGKPAEKQANAR